MLRDLQGNWECVPFRRPEFTSRNWLASAADNLEERIASLAEQESKLISPEKLRLLKRPRCPLICLPKTPTRPANTSKTPKTIGSLRPPTIAALNIDKLPTTPTHIPSWSTTLRCAHTYTRHPYSYHIPPRACAYHGDEPAEREPDRGRAPRRRSAQVLPLSSDRTMTVKIELNDPGTQECGVAEGVTMAKAVRNPNQEGDHLTDLEYLCGLQLITTEAIDQGIIDWQGIKSLHRREPRVQNEYRHQFPSNY